MTTWRCFAISSLYLNWFALLFSLDLRLTASSEAQSSR